MKLTRTVFILAILLCLPAIAIAADEPRAGYLAPVLADLIGVLAVALGAYVAKLGRNWARKVDAEEKYIKAAYADKVAERIVAEIEERAADFILREGPEILVGEKKLEAAVAKLLDLLPGIDEQTARELARAALVRIAAGASDKLQREREKRGMDPR